MKVIKVTSYNGTGAVYINVDHIGHIYETADKNLPLGRYTTMYTRIGVTTHNNGGFSVKETVEEVLSMIAKAESKVKS